MRRLMTGVAAVALVVVNIVSLIAYLHPRPGPNSIAEVASAANPTRVLSLALLEHAR